MAKALLEIHKLSCHRKRMYAKKVEADRGLVLRKVKLRLQGQGLDSLVTYYCRKCNYWHIGHVNDKLAKTFKRLGIIEEGL